MTDFMVEVINSETIAREQRIINHLSTSEDHVVNFTDDDNDHKALNSKFNVAKVGVSKGRHGVTSESLSQKWSISPEEERRTVQYSIQRGIRTILYPSLARKFKTND